MSPVRVAAPAGVLCTVLCAGCGGSDQSALDPASPASSKIATLWWVMFTGGVVVTAVVSLLVLLAYRASEALRDRYFDDPGELLD